MKRGRWGEILYIDRSVVGFKPQRGPSVNKLPGRQF
jgi:hypothetical protein